MPCLEKEGRSVSVYVEMGVELYYWFSILRVGHSIAKLDSTFKYLSLNSSIISWYAVDSNYIFIDMIKTNKVRAQDMATFYSFML